MQRIAIILASILAALGIGWLIGSSGLNRSSQIQASGDSHFERTDATLACIFADNYYTDELLARFQKRKLYICVTDAWKFRDEINSARNDDQAAIKLADKALWLLDYHASNGRTADEFLAFALALNPNNGGNYSPEIHDLASPEHASYSAFVKLAIAYERWPHDRVQPNGMEGDTPFAFRSPAAVTSLLEQRWPPVGIGWFCTPERRVNPKFENLVANGVTWDGKLYVNQMVDSYDIFWYGNVEDGHLVDYSLNVERDGQSWILEVGNKDTIKSLPDLRPDASHPRFIGPASDDE